MPDARAQGDTRNDNGQDLVLERGLKKKPVEQWKPTTWCCFADGSGAKRFLLGGAPKKAFL